VAVLELLTIKIQQMTIESTNLQNSTNPAITYNGCYAQPFFNLIFGESLELLKTMPNKSIDLILTDPPYNINVQRVNCAAHRKDNRSRTKVDWDNNFELQPFLDEFFRIGKHPTQKPVLLLEDLIKTFSNET
jgi:DNA modification methylase